MIDVELRPNGARWGLGDTVTKKRGSSWRGKVVGFYATENTEIGYSVESMFEPGSVQVWPEAALEDWVPSLPAPDTAEAWDVSKCRCEPGDIMQCGHCADTQAPATGDVQAIIAWLRKSREHLADPHDIADDIESGVHLAALTGGAEGDGT